MPSPPKKKITGRRGATLERSVLIAKIRRMKDEYGKKGPDGIAPFGNMAESALHELEAWIYARVPRFKARRGGL